MLPAPTRTPALRDAILRCVDPRLREDVERDLLHRGASARPPGPGQHVVLVGHRAAGKSTLLPHLAQWLGRPAVDLDRALERRSGRAIARWLIEDPTGFRRAERAEFLALPPGQVVAAGGGFLSLHADLLAPHLAVLVPVSFETYRERLLADSSRPRLRPELSLADELAVVFSEREALHARVPTIPLAQLLALPDAGRNG